MSFKKPFRAVPVRLSPEYVAEARRQHRLSLVHDVAKAVGGGIALGGAMFWTQTVSFQSAAVSFANLVIGRRVAPRSGDYWAGCDDARAAGVAPLYAGDPGYRPEMDGDSDGIACEPYRARTY